MPARSLSRLLGIALFVRVYAAPGVLAAQDGSPTDNVYPLVRYAQIAAEPVVEYNLIHHMLADPDPEPLLRIYGDGRVHVHYPAYMSRAGDYESHLSQSELTGLLRALAADGIMDFDLASARTERGRLKAQQRAAGKFFHISDSTVTVIQVRLDEYQRGAATQRVFGLNRRFAWPDLPQDVRRFPTLPEITNANQAAQRLETLLDRHDLSKIPD